ncbi:MAG: DUF1049 domain-containing protein [Deltaproteobacteria bacterium]|nr:DUF1049 domain-containing protein [Deltaproteobacteria bacterium]
MVRLVLIVVATAAVVAFAVANSHHIELSLVLGKPAQIRLIFVLGTTFLAGLVTGVLWSTLRQLRRVEAARAGALAATEPAVLADGRQE